MWSGQMIDALHRALGGTKHERTKFSFTDGLRDLPERKERNERNIQERRGSTLREHVLYGSLADIKARSRHVRFAPSSGHSSVRVGCPKSAISRHSPRPSEARVRV
jgi:hypothetical protein